MEIKMAIHGPAMAELTDTVIGNKQKPVIRMAVHRQATVNRTSPPVTPDITTSYSTMLNEGGINGIIQEGRSNYFHTTVDPLPTFQNSTRPTILTLSDLVASMDASMKARPYYKVLMDLISPNNASSIGYQIFMRDHAGFIVHYSYTSNGNVLDYQKFKTVMVSVNINIGKSLSLNRKKVYDNWMRIYSKLLVKLIGV